MGLVFRHRGGEGAKEWWDTKTDDIWKMCKDLGGKY